MIVLDRERVVRLWLQFQGLSAPRTRPLTRAAFVGLLERAGGLQLDSVNVLDRAHYLTLWSRFGAYDRARPDRWTYRERVAFEHWGHEASLLPASRLPLSRRGMRRFKPRGEWWESRRPSPASFRRVLARIRAEGPLESADFEGPARGSGPWWGWKEDKQALEFLWRRGVLAIAERRHFRRVYDLAERVYPPGPIASLGAYEDSWLLSGLAANGPARAAHLANYFTAPRLSASAKRRVLSRNLARGSVVEATVQGFEGPFLALPEHLDLLGRAPAAHGTTFLSPFDSLLWQRDRAAEMLGFDYRVEIYVPPPKRKFGYYAMPILHDGALVGRIDPKLHRDRRELEIRALHLQPGFDGGREFRRGMNAALEDLARFVGAATIALPARGA